MNVGLIFDLDDTLIDTACLAEDRRAGKWKKCAARFAETSAFNNMTTLIDSLRSQEVKVGVVTASVSYYATSILKHHGIEVDALVAYHDTKLHKPHPAPILLCLQKLFSPKDGTLCIGDTATDAAAYKAARLPALGAGWSPHLDRAAGWDAIIETPNDLLDCIRG